MRTINVGGNQGRGNPPAVQMDEPEGPGMAVSRWVYALGIACGLFWTGVAVLLIYLDHLKG